MSVVVCKSCHRRVLPRVDGTCPSCQQTTEGSPLVPELTDEDRARAEQHDQLATDERAQRERAARFRSKGLSMVAGGVALALFAVALSLASHALADGRGTYHLFIGGVIGGLALIFRGWSQMDRARQLLRDLP
jgi:hypothetical protein